MSKELSNGTAILLLGAFCVEKVRNWRAVAHHLLSVAWPSSSLEYEILLNFQPELDPLKVGKEVKCVDLLWPVPHAKTISLYHISMPLYLATITFSIVGVTMLCWTFLVSSILSSTSCCVYWLLSTYIWGREGNSSYVHS